MTRTAALFATLALAVAMTAAPAAGAALDGPVAPDQAEPASPAANETAEPPAPGARLAGVVAVQGAEVEGEFEARAFGVRVAAANSNASRARVVGERVSTLRDRANALTERKRDLVEAREEGRISEPRFHAEMAAVAARTGVLDRQLHQTASASSGLDPDLLAANDVDASAIERLRGDARNLSGPDVADIARTVAGPDVGGGLSVRGDAGVDPPGPDGTAGGGVNVTVRTPAAPGTSPDPSETPGRPDRPTPGPGPNTTDRPGPTDTPERTGAPVTTGGGRGGDGGPIPTPDVPPTGRSP